MKQYTLEQEVFLAYIAKDFDFDNQITIWKFNDIISEIKTAISFANEIGIMYGLCLTPKHIAGLIRNCITPNYIVYNNRTRCLLEFKCAKVEEWAKGMCDINYFGFRMDQYPSFREINKKVLKEESDFWKQNKSKAL